MVCGSEGDGEVVWGEEGMWGWGDGEVVWDEEGVWVRVTIGGDVRAFSWDYSSIYGRIVPIFPFWDYSSIYGMYHFKIR